MYLRIARPVAAFCAVILAAAAAHAHPLSPYTPATSLTLSNSTTSTLSFTVTSGGTATPWQLPPQRVLAASCNSTAEITVTTEDRPYKVEVPCGGAYQLYYDTQLKRYAVSASQGGQDGAGVAGDVAAPPAVANEVPPLQQLLNNQAGALTARANAVWR